MSVRVLPAAVAGLVAVVLAVLLFVPFVAREHRRSGELRPGTAMLFLAALLYALGLVAYVLVPLPPVAPGFCEAFDVRPQWRPFAGFDDLDRPHGWAELTGLLADGSVQQFGFNVLLFVPLGLVVRHLLRESFAGTVLAGFTASLGVELTQITGIWFLYPCPYRMFDVDDLIANTTGALVGAVLAPLLRLLPGQRSGADADAPRPVTASRRLLGMSCDLLVLFWLGSTLGWGTELLLRATGVQVGPQLRPWVESGAVWVVPALFLLLVAVLGRGSTVGQRAVLLRSAREGGPVGPRSVLLRWLTGLGGLATLQGLVNIGWPQAGSALALAWCSVHALGVLRTGDHRGITGHVAGTEVLDGRASAAQLTSC